MKSNLFLEGFNMKKTGRVINFDDSKVYIITKDKEFVTVERTAEEPIKGHSYCGREYIDRSNLIKILTIIIIVALLAIAGIYYYAFSARSSIVISMFENTKIGINKNTIVSISDINGVKYTGTDFPAIKGDTVNEGLCLLLDYSFKNELLTQRDEYSPGTIYIFITKKGKNDNLDFTEFQEYAAKFNYNVVINRNDNVLNLNQ